MPLSRPACSVAVAADTVFPTVPGESMARADKIVLIDDDRVVGEVVSGLASAMGLHCAVTRTPDEFFRHIGAETGVILLDLVMPEMDGIEILRLLGERNCKARIILMSGINIRVIETAKKLAQSLGLTVVGHLQKPFPIPQLQQMLTEHLTSEKPEAAEKEEAIAIHDEDIFRALERKEFVLYYQPQIKNTSNNETNNEAQSRWNHPELGLVF